MSEGEKNNSGCGCASGPMFLLAIIFIILKVADIITWPWVWVLIPLWIEMVICLGFLLFFFLGASISGLFLIVLGFFVSLFERRK